MLSSLKIVNIKRQLWHSGRKFLFINHHSPANFHTSIRLLGAHNFERSTPEPDDATGCNKNKYRKLLKPLAACGLALLSGFLSYKYLYGEKKESSWLNFNSLISLKAATPTSKKLKESYRAKFNYIADVVELAAPAVVFIEIKDKRHVDYFTREPVTASNGSGFIVDSNGLILTNAHVVINKPHTFVQVKLQDGRSFIGRVETVDPTSDLATVRIDCKDLPTLKLGTSADLRAGEWVVALGSPLALQNTVTTGVVSSAQRPSRDLGLRGKDINYIQTDAAITFGNSGGPLINLDGEVIGINSMKVTAGISFAIPIDYVRAFLTKSQQSRSQKQFQPPPTRRYMGITMLTLTDEILSELRQRSHSIPADLKNGVLIWKVILGSPSHVAGLTPGDIVTEINGKVVSHTSDIYGLLSEKGRPLVMTIYRGSEKLKITIYPEEIDE